MSGQPYAGQCPRACTRTGAVAHLLLPFASLNTPGAALCGTVPGDGYWRGSGSQAEAEALALLPMCGRCAKQAADRDAADAVIAAARGGRDA